MKFKQVPEFFTWTVKIRVHKSWVMDGFDLSTDRVQDMVSEMLPYAEGAEITAQITSRPNADLISKAQGYLTDTTYLKEACGAVLTNEKVRK